VEILAPAKINLSLKILGKRDDGFHEIESLIAPVSLYDKLLIERQNRWIDLSCDDPTLSTGEDNLVVRAAQLFFEHAGVKGGVAIKLEKKIPQGAGLGGGSSDAAATLRGLNLLFETKLSQDDVSKLAAALGSDVSFFLNQSAALCKGRGEIVEPRVLGQPLSILLLKPGFAVPTSWAYSRWKDSKEIPGVPYAPQKLYGQSLMNDLERPVFQKFVFLGQLKSWLLEQPEVAGALMSGSGSTVFAVLRPKATADDLANRAKTLDREIWTAACETL